MKVFYKKLIVVSLVSLGFVLPGFAFAVSSINLGTAENFVVLSKAAVSNVGASSVAGDIGADFGAGVIFPGFDSVQDASNQFASSRIVNGKLYTSSYSAPASAILVQGITDMEMAYNEATTRNFPTAIGKGGGEIGGLSFPPGLYKWNTNVVINSDVTLLGGAEDVWVFQARENLNIGQGVKIILTDGALAKNIFWQVAGQTTIGSQAVFNGNILGQGAIVLQTGAVQNGRALGIASVTLDANTITKPGLASFIPSATIPIIPVVPASPTTPTNESLQAQADILLATVQALLAQAKSAGLSLSSETISVIKPVSHFAQNLSLGSKGSDVSALQTFLIAKKVGANAAKLSLTGATSYFGTFTQKALIEFQKSAGITPASGYFGPKTRAYVGSL